MPIIMAIVSFALLIWIEPASAQKSSAQRTYPVSVSVHSELPELTEQEVKKILADASKVLQKDPGHEDWDDDVACNVTFTLQGPVRTFSSPDKQVFDLDVEDVHRVHADVAAGADFHVKVVERIMFCRGTQGNFRGCSFPPQFRSIIVVHPQKHADDVGQRIYSVPDHVLWAHEFGHLTGLGHRKSKRALMKCGGITDVSVRVNRRECRCLLAGPGPGSCQLPPAQWC